MNLMRIRLELARTPEFPSGNARHGYEFVAPLTAEGHIDSQAWTTVKNKCVVRHFWNGHDDKSGFLRHVGHGWKFDYGTQDDEDEAFFKLDRHTLAAGDYVSVTESDGVMRPFKIVAITPLNRV